MAPTPPRRRLRHALWATLLAAVVAAPAALVAGPAAADAAREDVTKERAEPSEPAPVTVAGVRYEAPPWLRSRGLPQNGGYVVAYDAASGAELWMARIYGLRGPADLEQDKREVFIVAMQASASGRYLWITDERHRRWRLDLQTRRVKRLGGGPPAPR